MKKKTLVITGGSRGIGFGIVKQMASEGYNAAILDVNSLEDYQENFEQLKQYDIEYLYVQGDVSIREDQRELFETGFRKIWRY